MALADIYAAKDRAQARKMLEEVQKENADNMIGNIAQGKLASLK
jgi:hypothetical protein